MTIERLKLTAATLAGGAIIAAIGCVLTNAGFEQHVVAGGSGASATGTTYTQPTIAPMSLASTTTVVTTEMNDAAPTSLATTDASPTFKASAAAGCVNNGQCP